MASWTKTVPKGKTTRRKWNVEDRTSLKNLKYHFAADGCSDVQYDLARQLLETNSDLDETSSHIQGIHWLLCAAQQGHESALNMLRQCYKTRRGINEENEDDVKSCLFMTNGERAARKAARELFACLSNGSEHITPAQLERKMRDIYKLQKRKRYRLNSTDTTSDEDEIDHEKKPIDNEDRSADNKMDRSNGNVYPSLESSRVEIGLLHDNLITEANLVNAAVNYSRGQLPVFNGVLMLSIPNPNSLDHVPCFHRILFHPIIFFTLLYHRFIKMISSFPGSTESNLKIIFMFLAYALISNENLSLFIPLIMYYMSLAVMIWSTFKMLKTKHDFIDFRIWSGLFLSYGDNNVEVGNSENLFLRNNMKPYLYFFIAFIINLIVYPVISNEWLPNSEVTITSFMMIFITMISFMYTSSKPLPDILVLLSFGINVLAKYPYETDKVVATGWRFLDLKVPTFCSFVIGNGIEFCLNCRGVFYLMIPGLMMQLAKRSKWHGTYTYLIPHIVTLSWLQLCLTTSQSATMFGLMRGTLGLAAVMLFLPLFGIVTLMIPIFVVIDWLGFTDPKVRIATSITSALFAILGSCLLAVNHRTQKYVTLLQVSLCVMAAAILTLPYMTTNFKTSHSETSILNGMFNVYKTIPNLNTEEDISSTMSWEKFYSFCGQPAWEKNNKIRAQFRCSQLEGTFIKWEGSVQQVEIVKVSNFRQDFITNYLPTSLGNFIKCFYGGKTVIDCDNNKIDNCDDMLEFFAEQKQCNLNKWNIYEYEIKIRMHSGILSPPGVVFLKVGNSFGNFSAELKNGDQIWFTGTLLNTRGKADETTVDMVLGVGQPIVDLLSVGCVQCHNKNLNVVKIKTDIVFKSRIRDLMRGVKYLLNVLFNPLITFK